jgi:histone H3/H4
MANLLNQSAARKLAKSMNIHLGTSGIKALNVKMEEIIHEAALRSRKSRRKTILERDVVHEKDLFSL